MSETNFINLAKQGEGIQVEYKTCYEDISDSLYETVCSFLNHTGGHILVGVDDDGNICGVNPSRIDILKKNIINAIKNQELFLPSPYFTPEILNIDGKDVILLDIPCGQYVYRYKGRYWDRNGDADIDVSDSPELLLSLFERKNPHLFEEKVVEGLSVEDLDHSTFQFCRNILAVKKPEHPWIQISDEEILVSTRLAVRDKQNNQLRLKYAALILFGKEDSIAEYMPRYRFEAFFHMCTYDEYSDISKFPNRYDDRRTLRCNLINVYNQLSQFTERYLPDKFYLPAGTTQREDLRWELFREIVANLCVHSDYSSGYACFYHVFKDRVVTKNPTRLHPEIPEGELSLTQLDNYTKNPLLVRVFHELSWVEDMGSGTRNILRYAPLYYPNYKVEINNGTQFIFSITYMDVSAPQSSVPGTENSEMALKDRESGTKTEQLAPKNAENGTKDELDDDELAIYIGNSKSDKKTEQKKNKRKQGIIKLVKENPGISIPEMADKLDSSVRTIKRDIEELNKILIHEGPSNGGRWILASKKTSR